MVHCRMSRFHSDNRPARACHCIHTQYTPTDHPASISFNSLSLCQRVCGCVCFRGLTHSLMPACGSWFIQTQTHSGAPGDWPITGFHSWIITGQWHFSNIWKQTAVWRLFTADLRTGEVLFHTWRKGEEESCWEMLFYYYVFFFLSGGVLSFCL